MTLCHICSKVEEEGYPYKEMRLDELRELFTGKLRESEDGNTVVKICSNCINRIKISAFERGVKVNKTKHSVIEHLPDIKKQLEERGHIVESWRTIHHECRYYLDYITTCNKCGFYLIVRSNEKGELETVGPLIEVDCDVIKECRKGSDYEHNDKGEYWLVEEEVKDND